LFVGAIAGVDRAVNKRSVEQGPRIGVNVAFAAVREVAQSRHDSRLTAIGV
jgi:hypothetical protein